MKKIVALSFAVVMVVFCNGCALELGSESSKVKNSRTYKFQDLKWITPKNGQRPTISSDGVVNMTVGGLQRGYPREIIKLNGYKYLNFTARSTDGKQHLVYFYIRRRLAPSNRASFYSVFELSPSWKNYHLRLQSGQRNTPGIFSFSKGDKNCDRTLSGGGELLFIQLASKSSVAMRVKGLAFTTDAKPRNDEMRLIVEQIKEHPKFIPYRFKKIIKPDAVSASGFKIAIRPDASPAEKFAAAELAKYLKKATGADFPILDSAENAGNVIKLAIAPSSRHDGFSSEFLDGKTLKITGDSPRGLVYAVYDFLEKTAGIRWFAPFEYAVVIPYNPDLKFPLFKDASFPLITYRMPHYCSNGRVPGYQRHLWAMADWAFKNRFNVELEHLPKDIKKKRKFYEERGGCIWLPKYFGHNLHKLISPKKYFKTHPEYFCFDRAIGKYRAKRTQLCTTNPGLIKELGRLADEYFKERPDEKFFPLFQEDGSRLWCQCAACLALNPSGSNLLSATENNINLANSVCREIKKKYPNKGVITYAYSVTRQPPVRIVPIPGVRVSYCFSPSSPDQMPWDSLNGLNIVKWSRLTKGNMLVYSYHYLNMRYTYNNEDVLMNTYRMMSILDIKGCKQETSETWGGLDGFLLYQSARLAWNPWFDANAFKADYFQKMYGAGAKPMREFHDLLSAVLCDKTKRLSNGFRKYPSIPARALVKMSCLMKSAEKAVANDLRATKAVNAQIAYLGLMKSYSNAMERADAYYRKPTKEGYLATLAAIKELGKLNRKLAPTRIVSVYWTRLYDAWKRNLEASWRSNSDLLELKSKYRILKTLNPWKFKTDPKSVGDDSQWFATRFDDGAWRTIKSGDFWEKQGMAAYDGAGWYRLTLNIPSSKKRLGLYFGAADERAWVYLDGKYIGGHHKGDVGKLWNESFTVMFPKDISSGKHQITVKVIDSAGVGGLWKDVYLVSEK